MFKRKVTYAEFAEHVFNFYASDLHSQTKALEQKLDLILDYLELDYVSETVTKEPAKLVEKPDNFYENVVEPLIEQEETKKK